MLLLKFKLWLTHDFFCARQTCLYQHLKCFRSPGNLFFSMRDIVWQFSLVRILLAPPNALTFSCRQRGGHNQALSIL